MDRKKSTEDESNSSPSGSGSSPEVKSLKNRLGICEVCNFNNANYACPKCEVKTCQLKCLIIHKKELNCSGIRDRTKFIPIRNITEQDFMNDYRFLEECTRFVAARKRDQIKRYTRYKKNLPRELFKLRNAAQKRTISLRFLLDNFTRRSTNTTIFDGSAKTIFWHVDWIFPCAGNLKFSDHCSEKEKVLNLLKKYLNVEESINRTSGLELYASRGTNNLRILLKAEGVKKCANRFYELDLDESLNENLSGKVIVEYPTIYVIYDEIFAEYDVIENDEFIKNETENYWKQLNEIHNNNRQSTSGENASNKKTEAELDKEFKQLEIAQKREQRRLKRLELEKDGHNYLFSDDKLWDQLSSDTDSHDETEEEMSENESPNKKVKSQ